mmetsp:Transcript_14375/g.32703  ORF Transcript_14375/g.32703 Transcript_14375/m.32703 type:complete len:326 (+) Transcript_14375:30-1007(+)
MKLWLLLLSSGLLGSEAAVLWPYEEKLSRVFATLTQASYCGADERLREWTCSPCRDAGVEVVPGSVRFISRRELVQPNSTFVLIARLATLMGPQQEAGCLVSFRGSETFTNWIEDFRFWNRIVPFDWCKDCFVEDGFSSVWRNVAPELLAHLLEIGCVPANRSNASTTSSLFITGHSLGAAVGTLAMCSLQALGYQVGLSFLFESPRVGNKEFAEAFDQEFSRKIPAYRITHARDPVPHLPPRNLIGFKYRHVNYEVFYDREGQWRFCDQQEDPSCADQYSLLGTLPFVGDHCATPLAPEGSICHCPVKSDPNVTKGRPTLPTLV